MAATATATPPDLAGLSDRPPSEVPARRVGVTELTGYQKGAVLLIALGVEASSRVLPLLPDDEMVKISIEIARFQSISSDMLEAVLLDFRDMTMAQNYVAQGGVSFARQVLEAALGERRAEDILMKIEAAMEVSAFHLLQTVETGQLSNFIMNEHPQTAALILAHLNSRKAADILATMAAEQQTEIVYRLATMGKTSPELLREIEEVIRQQLGSVFGAELSTTGGVEKVAEILNSASRAAERSIMESIRDRDEDLANAIKNLMFVFDDLAAISDRDMQRLLMEVEQSDLVLALKAAAPELRDKILRSVSQRVAETLREELELAGPARVRDVDEAQMRILKVAQDLEAKEEIILSQGKDEMMM